MPVLYTFRY